MGVPSPLQVLFSVSALFVLAGCAGSPVNLDPGNVNGRDGGGPVPSYPMLMRMGAVNEAIVSYNQALVRPGDTQGAQVGLAKAFLETGKPQLASAPLSKALEANPQDPKLRSEE